MTSRTLYRLSGAALIVGSALTIAYYISEAFISRPFPEALAGSVAVLGSLIGFIGSLLVLLGLPGMYARQAQRAGILGLVGFVLVWYVTLFQGILIPFTSVTIVPMLVTNPATRPILAAGELASFQPFFLPSLAGQVLGILMLAIATLRAQVFPRWIAWLLIATLILNGLSQLPFVPEALGNIAAILTSIAIAGFGYALILPQGRETVQSVPAAA
jgi:hypothetical protein